jgi:hypothetical protein
VQNNQGNPEILVGFPDFCQLLSVESKTALVFFLLTFMAYKVKGAYTSGIPHLGEFQVTDNLKWGFSPF